MKKVDAAVDANATAFQKFAISKQFNMYMMTVIVLNCITMAMEDPKIEDPAGQVAWIVGLNWFFNFMYVMEVSVGIGAFGLVRYLLDPWHYIDIAVSAISLLDILVVVLNFIVIFFGGAGLVLGTSTAANFKILRVVRVLRPLKAISFIPSLLVYIESVSQSATEIFSNMLLLVMVMFCFAATGCAWIGNALAYRCIPLDLASNYTMADPHFQAFGASYFSSKYNTNFCGQSGLKPSCNPGFHCMPLTYDGYYVASSGDYSTPWRSFISNLSFLSLRGWPLLFWQIADTKGLLIAYVMFSINVLFGTLMVVNLFPAIFICTFRKNQEKLNKNTWLLYYPGIIDEVKEVELFRWVFSAGNLLKKAAEEASEASVPTELYRWIYSKLSPAGHEAAMKKLAEKKDAWINTKENSGMDADDRLGVVPWRPCFPNCSATWNKLRPMVLKDNSYFSMLIIATIFANIILLSSESSSSDPATKEIQFWINVVFNAIFGLEVVVKLSLLGPCVYLDSLFNIFDLFLVIMGLLQYGATVPKFVTNLRIIRLLRLARVYKLVNLIKAEKIKVSDPTVTPGRLMSMLMDFIPPMANALLMTVILLYAFSLIGMQFMIFKYPYDEHPTALVYPVPSDATPYDLFDTFAGKYRVRMNFNNFMNAYTTVFNIMTFNGWYGSMLDTIRNQASTSFAWFYIVVIFLCNYFTISALAATVCNVMDMHATEAIVEKATHNSSLIISLAKTRQKVIIRRYFETFKTNTVQNEEARAAAKASGAAPMMKTTINITEQFDEASAMSFYDLLMVERRDYSFFLFQPIEEADPDSGGVKRHKNARYYLTKLYVGRPFQACIWIALIWAVLSILAIQDQATEQYPALSLFLDLALVIVFFLEMLLKMAMQTVQGYFRNNMNMVDVACNIAMIISLIFPKFDLVNRIRILRLVKIPEMVQHFSSSLSLKLLVRAVEEAIMSLTTIVMTFFLLTYFYGVIGLQSWDGKFLFCSDRDYPGGTSFYATSTNYPNGCNGLAYVRDQYDNFFHWTNIAFYEHVDSFTDIFASCKCVFKVLLMNEFQSILYDSLDVMDDYFVQPINNNSRISFLYFLFGAILGLCILELFMSTIYYHYMIAQLQYGRKPAFSAAQAAWNAYEGKLRHVHEDKNIVESLAKTTRVQVFVASVLNNRYYGCLIFCYCMVPLILYVAYFESTYSRSYFAFVDLVFTFFYMFDYLLRFLLIGPRIVQRDGKYELIVLTVLSVSVVQVFPALSGLGVTSFQLKFTWACVMLRMYRMVHSSELMMQNLRTLQMSISGIFPVLLYLFMTTLIFAVIGRTAFETTVMDYGSSPWLNEKFNFSTYNKAVMTLVAMGTGNFYTEVIMAIMGTMPKGYTGFGWRVFVEIYFLMFMLVFTILLRSFGLMVILKYIDHTGGMIGLAEEQIRDFQKVWRSLNKDSSDRISFNEFRHLIGRLRKPLGMKGDEQKWIVVERFLKQVLLCMPCPSKYFLDTMDNKDPEANKRNHRRRDLYSLADLPDSLSDLMHDTTSQPMHFTFKQCLIAVHKMALMPKPLPDEETFLAQRKVHKDRLGHLRMAVARLAISEVGPRDAPNAHAFRLLQILQRLDPDLYHEIFLSIMERTFKSLQLHVAAYGFQGFDGFVLDSLYKAMKLERRAADLILRTKKALKESGSPKFMYIYQKAQVYNNNVLRLFLRVEEMYEANVAQKWDITTVGKIKGGPEVIRERKPVSAIEVDHHSNVYVACNGTLKVYKNMTGDAAVTRATKYRKMASISFDKVHIRCVCAAGDGKRVFVAVGSDVHMYALAGGKSKKKSPFRQIRTFAHDDNVNCCLLFGKYLVSCSSDGYVTLWALTTFAQLNRFFVGAGIADTLGLGGDLSVFCACLMPIAAPGVPKDDLKVTDAIVCGTASGQLVMLPMPLTPKDESAVWIGKRVAVNESLSLPVTCVRYAWTYIYAALANGSVTVFAVNSSIELMNDGEDKLCFISLINVSYQPIHNAPITGLSFCGDHIFTASHDFSMLPLSVPESLTAMTPKHYEQEIGSGLVIHAAPILCMACNNHILVTGDNNGVIHVTGPSISEALLQDGSPVDPLASLINFSFLDYDFGNVMCAHAGRTLEEECYLAIANNSEDTIKLRWIMKKNACWLIEPARKDIKPKRFKKKVLYEIASNEKMEFRIVFRPGEAKFYRFALDFLINEAFVVTIHTKGTGVTPKLIFDGISTMVDFGTVDVISPLSGADEIGEGEIRVLSLLSASTKDVIANLVEEVLEDKDTKTTFTMSDRNISVSPRCFKVPAMEGVTIVVKFTPSEAYSTFEVPLRFNIAGAQYTLATLRFRSAAKKEPRSLMTITASPGDKTAANVPGQKVNMMSVHALPKGLRALAEEENIVNSGMVLGLLAHRGWRLSSDDVLSCLYHMDTGVFLELPRQIDAHEIVDHVEEVKIKFTCDYDSYFELWHDEVYLTGGFATKDKERDVVVKKDLLFICQKREKKGGAKGEMEEAWLECIGTIVLELLVFARQPHMGKPSRPTKKFLVPTKDPSVINSRGILRSRTDIIVHKGFRLAPGENGIGYDFLDRMDVAGIERVCTFSEDGYASLYETFREPFSAPDKHVSPIFGSASLTIHTTMDDASPTHFKVRDVTGKVDMLHHHDHELHGHMHVHSKEDQITHMDGNQLVDLGRPHVMTLQKQKGADAGYIMQGRVVEVYLNRKSGAKGEVVTTLLNPKPPDESPPNPLPKGYVAPPSKPTTQLYCHTMVDMASRSKSANVPVAKLLPHALVSPSHSVRVTVHAVAEPELRLAKLSSMIDEMKGMDVKAAERNHGSGMTSTLHDGLFHFILAGNDLKLVSADLSHSRYHESRSSTDITLTAHGFVAKLDNAQESILYADEGYVLQVDDEKDRRPDNGKKMQRFDNYLGTAIPAIPAPTFLQEIWDVRVSDAFVDTVRRAFSKLLEQRQHEMQRDTEAAVKRMEKETAEKEKAALAKRGAKAAKEVRTLFLQQCLKMEAELSFERSAKLIYADLVRRVNDFQVALEEEERKNAAAAMAAGGGSGGSGGGGGRNKKAEDREKEKANVAATKRSAETRGKLVVPLLQEYLEKNIVPGRDVPLSKAMAERVLRGMDRDAATGVVTPDSFKLWYESKPSTQLMAELTERTVFARLLHEEYQHSEKNFGFDEEEIDDEHAHGMQLGAAQSGGGSSGNTEADDGAGPGLEAAAEPSKVRSKFTLSGMWGKLQPASKKGAEPKEEQVDEEMKEDMEEDGGESDEEGESEEEGDSEEEESGEEEGDSEEEEEESGEEEEDSEEEEESEEEDSD